MTRLGRETEKTIILQAKKANRRGERKEKPESGVLEVIEFTGNKGDSELLRVISSLEYLTAGLP